MTENEILEILETVNDPEIPVLTIVDLGIVRKISVDNEKIEITITPTYTGCPAMLVIEKDIKDALIQKGVKEENIKIATSISPAWTTDWLSEIGRKKLEEYGIAPPVNEVDKSLLFAEPTPVPCPICKSKNTKMVSQFGSTSCKAHYQCKDCLEPFDYFKCLK